MRAFPVVAALATALPVLSVQAQSINPDISVIGDIRAFVTEHPDDSRRDELQLDLHGAELMLAGYLNPFARADVVVAYHDGAFELEEAYATILRGLPGRLQLKAGRYRLDFGKLNQLHPHTYSFLDTPLVHRELLGEEGLIDIGLNLNTQVPLGTAALTLSGNVLKGDFAEVHHHDHDHEEEQAAALQRRAAFAVRPAHEGEEEPEPERGLGYSGRLAVFVPTGDYAGFEAGLNALEGTLDRHTDRTVRLLGVDLKYRWAPDMYRSLTVQGEWIRSRRDVAHAHGEEGHGTTARVDADGMYAFVDWRFARRWNCGVVGERSELAEEEGVRIRRAGVFAGFQLMEETTLVRLLVRRTDHDELRKAYSEGILQLVFSLGPHRAHWF
ncbi:MAG TPA: hypothetical protein P5234_08475 [Thermoanaerobaculaceae bacterium]|nr:hypothetical protein [Thermoanaerobaculaceae bacterium]HRS16265.1 hypothetical protein [Thermoanaerobaculaceae bacterium]